METVTEALQSAVHFQTQRKGIERANELLDLIERATNKAARKRHEAEHFCSWSVYLVNKTIHQAEIAEMAAARLTKSYKRQLFNLFYKSKF